MQTLHEFTDYFKDEKTCYEFLETKRWGAAIICPHCNAVKTPYKVKTTGKFKDIPTYRCANRACDLRFTVRTKSVFEGSQVELRKWFQAAYEISTNKKGISSYNLAARIGVSQKTAWFLNHRIRTMLVEWEVELLGENKGMVEADETYVGGKNKNRHKSKRVAASQGRACIDKTPVVGLVERNGIVRTFVTKNTSAETLREIIDWNVSDDAIIVTDAYKSYAGIGSAYEHIVVKHEDGGYVVKKDGKKFHTQNIENFWSQLKRGYIGTHHYISPQHLHRYCQEFATRYNMRDLKNTDLFLHVIQNSDKRKITYKVLTTTQKCG